MDRTEEVAVPDRDVVAVVGLGDVGVAITRRIAAGRTVVIADRNAELLSARERELGDAGHAVVAVQVDVTSAGSVRDFADTCGRLGSVRNVVHTAGVSPVQASVETILAVDLLGTALVIDAFCEVVAAGGSGLVIASMAAYIFPPPPATVERELAITPSADLLGLESLQPIRFSNPAEAYALAKQANNIRVAAFSKAWGERGATLNAISPGVIATAMGREELDGANGAIMRHMVESSGAARLGTPDDIASAAAFLLSPAASFITGASLLVDGGVHAATRFDAPRRKPQM
jgi:NAD(P)-dependent dehydrogenase (short-subunit alcohol dehydrogenase family)